MELRSLQTSEGASLLAALERDSSREVVEEQLELLADSVMLEDVIKEQKLQAEILEGEREVSSRIIVPRNLLYNVFRWQSSSLI